MINDEIELQKEIYILNSFEELAKEFKDDLLFKDDFANIVNKATKNNIFGSASNILHLKNIFHSEDIILGTKSGILATKMKYYYFYSSDKEDVVSEFQYDDFKLIDIKKKLFGGEEIIFKNYKQGKVPFEKEIFKKINISAINVSIKIDNLKKSLLEAEKIKNELRQKEIEEERVKMLKQNQSSILLDLDKNKDGFVDLIENDFNKLISKNQKRVMDMDKNYIHQFVKISNFIKTKKQNTQKIFESIRDTSSQVELEDRVSLLKNQIHSYELLVFHSINMIGALISEDLITFYEIYESFDKLGMFNSNWENEVSEKLTNIGNKLDDLMYSIYNMEQNIVSELSHLSYVTQESFEDLNRSVTSQLREVESSINTNNLLTGIQTYQLYKINKNTKGLR
jgi:hypothetical protein